MISLQSCTVCCAKQLLLMQAALRPTWVSVANTSLYPTGAFGVWGSGRTGSMAAIGGKESVHKVGATAVVLSICPAGRPMIMYIIALTMWCCMHDTQLVSARHDQQDHAWQTRVWIGHALRHVPGKICRAECHGSNAKWSFQAWFSQAEPAGKGGSCSDIHSVLEILLPEPTWQERCMLLCVLCHACASPPE